LGISSFTCDIKPSTRPTPFARTLLDILSIEQCTYHLLSCGSTLREPRGNDTGLVFLLSLQEGELYSFGNNFAGPRDLFESWSMVGPVVKSPIKPILD